LADDVDKNPIHARTYSERINLPVVDVVAYTKWFPVPKDGWVRIRAIAKASWLPAPFALPEIGSIYVDSATGTAVIGFDPVSTNRNLIITSGVSGCPSDFGCGTVAHPFIDDGGFYLFYEHSPTKGIRAYVTQSDPLRAIHVGHTITMKFTLEY